MNAIRKIVPVLLLGVILFMSGRYLVFTSVVKSQKREFRQIILFQKDKNIEELFVAEKDLYKDRHGLEWKENNREVVINNIYHEVLSVVKKENGYLVQIIADDLENSLFTNFNKSGNGGKKLADYLLLVFSFNFFIPLHNELTIPGTTRIVYTSEKDPANLSGFNSKTIKPPAVHA